MNYNLEPFKNGLKALDLTLSENQIQQFISYYELLIEWNKVMNLTGITEFDEVIEKHFLDSLCLNKVMDLNKKMSLLDLGTGAGFPGDVYKRQDFWLHGGLFGVILFRRADLIRFHKESRRVTYWLLLC